MGFAVENQIKWRPGSQNSNGLSIYDSDLFYFLGQDNLIADVDLVFRNQDLSFARLQQRRIENLPGPFTAGMHVLINPPWESPTP